MNVVYLKGITGNKKSFKSKAGLDILRFSVKTSTGTKNKDGSWSNKFMYHNIVVFGPKAQMLEAMMNDGDQAFVTGELTLNEYVDKQGVKQKSISIVAKDVVVQSGGTQSGRFNTGSNPSQSIADIARGAVGLNDHDDVSMTDSDDDDLPF